MANWIHNTACPYCGSRDNRAEYDDGSSWCWGCGRYESPSGFEGFGKPSAISTGGKTVRSLPEDIRPCTDYKAITWLRRFDMADRDISQLRLLWSDRNQWLIFPVFSDENKRDLISWQARCFRPDSKAKYISANNIKDMLYIMKGSDDWLTLTEGVLDAYKVNKAGYSSMPIFGSHISSVLASRLAVLGYTRLRIWLDPDKVVEALKFSKMLQELGFLTEVIMSDVDPKESDINKYIIYNI